MTTSLEDSSANITDVETTFAGLLALSGNVPCTAAAVRGAGTVTDEPLSDEQVKAICDRAKRLRPRWTTSPCASCWFARRKLRRPARGPNHRPGGDRPEGRVLPAREPEAVAVVNLARAAPKRGG